MGEARTRAEIGRSNSRRGKDVERSVVAWLRHHGFPRAERAVRTGYSNGASHSPDPGDITGTPGVVWQVTDRADIDQDAVLAARLADTEVQRERALAHYGLLVVRRRGVADPGRWWVHMGGQSFVELFYGGPFPRRRNCRIRTTLGEIVPILRQCGYGEPLKEKADG